MTDDNVYFTLFDRSREAIIISGPDGTVIDANRAAVKLLGHPSLKCMLGSRSVTAYVHPEQRQAIFCELEEKGFIENFEVELLKQDGSNRSIFVLVSAIMVKDDQGRLKRTEAILTDVTDRKLLEQELLKSRDEVLNLARHLEIIREQERAKIALNLHDDLGQQLTALNLAVAYLKTGLKNTSPEIIEKVDGITSMVVNSMNTLHAISTELRPGILDDLGLTAALEWQLDEFMRRTGIRYHFTNSPDDYSVSPELSILIFRVAQEALTNITRHAGAKEVHMDLESANGHLTLTITDNGRGIRPNEVNNPRAFGIIGMRERVKSLGGDFKIEGMAGKGTTIKIIVPKVHANDKNTDH